MPGSSGSQSGSNSGASSGPGSDPVHGAPAPDGASPDHVDIHQMSDTLYQQLRRVSGGMMRDERGSHTLSPTALVGAAVERMLETNQTQFNDRAHLLASAALAMRRVLVEHARARNRLKRGGGRGRVSWDDVIHALATRERPELLLEIDDAISALAKQDPRGARLVEMKLFGAMENAEIAAVLSVSVSTVEKDWRFYKPKLLTLMGAGGPGVLAIAPPRT